MSSLDFLPLCGKFERETGKRILIEGIIVNLCLMHASSLGFLLLSSDFEREIGSDGLGGSVCSYLMLFLLLRRMLKR